MAKDEAYRIAEKKINEARWSGAKELDLGITPGSDMPQLTELPESLGQFSQLHGLDLTGNQMTALPEWLGQFSQLRRLDIAGNRLTALPESLGQLSQLQTLNLLGNQLTVLPECLGQLSQLQELDLTGNQLTELPEWLGQLSQLQELILDGNRLTALPESLGQLSQLQELDLTVNRLTALPESLGHLTQLQMLNLSGNRLTALPESLGQLGQLQRLYLNDNQLRALPESLGRLTKLKRLYLNDNQLRVLPEAIKSLLSLKGLFLHGNPALGLSVEILGPNWREVQGNTKPADPAAVLDYYFKTRHGKGRPLNEVKLILVGRGGVGKTSLVNRLIRGEFCKTARTEGIAVEPWKLAVDGRDVRLNVWDFGGQEMMHATHQFFLTERSVYLVVVSNREGWAMADAEYWLKLIQSFGGNSPVLLVRNRIRETYFALDEEVLREKYPMLSGPSVATDCVEGIGCKEVSVQLRCAIAGDKEWRQPFPKSWWAIKEALENPSTSKSYLTRTEFEALCAQHGETDASKQQHLATALKQLGIIVHYWDDPRLRETAVLRPEWLTEGIYKLLNDRQLAVAKGVVRMAEVARILPHDIYPKAQHGFLFEVLRKFRLCHEIPKHKDTWLLPELLPEAQPKEVGVWIEKECLTLRYRYGVLPEGLVPRLIAQAFPLVYHEQQWRFGVVLEMDGAFARVRADRMDRRVMVLVREGTPEARKRLLSYVRACLEEMHGEFKELEVETQFRQAGSDAEWEDYDGLVKLENADEKALAKSTYGLIDKRKVAEKLDSVATREERGYELFDKVGLKVGSLVWNLMSPNLFFGKDVLNEIALFVSYAHADRDLKAELDVRLKILQRRKLISKWDDGMIPPGKPWNEEILANLKKSRIILLLVSPEFLASDYINDHEVPLAMEMHGKNQATVIPIKLRMCNWEPDPYSALQAPNGGNPVVGEHDTKYERDAAWLAVEEAIEEAARSLKNKAREKLLSHRVVGGAVSHTA